VEAVNPSTIILFETMIRLIKGAATALEKWLESQKTK
jgi:hypothetical protein